MSWLPPNVPTLTRPRITFSLSYSLWKLDSTLAIVGLSGVAAKTMVTTTISAAFGAVTTVLLAKLHLGYWDAGAANNGLLGGLVGITAGCSTCEPEGAFVIGVMSGFVYTYASKALVAFKVSLFLFHFFCRWLCRVLLGV